MQIQCVVLQGCQLDSCSHVHASVKQQTGWMVLQGGEVCQGRWTVHKAAVAEAASSAAAIHHALAMAIDSLSADRKLADTRSIFRISHCNTSAARAGI